jgi:hypothetical protein
MSAPGFIGRSRLRKNRRTHISSLILLLPGPSFSPTQQLWIKAKIPKEFFLGGGRGKYKKIHGPKKTCLSVQIYQDALEE